MELERVKQVIAALRREGVAYKVFGGVALNLHGLARFTQDLDLFVASTAENVSGGEVVTPRQLYEMKKDTVRLRDRGDAELLRERFGLDEEEP